MSARELDVTACPLDGINLIEASAGTGKTWNICALYLRLLLERGLRADQILVVTFTNAATAELRQRIRDRIADTLRHLDGHAAGDEFVRKLIAGLRQRGDDERLRAHLRAALESFDEAAIQTIHGFCQRALADAPFTAAMPMALELAGDAGDLVPEVANDYWRKCVASGDLAPEIVDCLLGEKYFSPEYFSELLKARLKWPLSQLIWPLGGGATGDAAVQHLAAAHTAARALWQRDREQIIAQLEADRLGLSQTSYKADQVAQSYAAWDEWLSRANPLDAAGGHEKLDLLTTARITAALKKKQTWSGDHPFFDLAGELLEARAAVVAQAARQRIRLLQDLVTEGPDEVRRRRRERRILTFDDMLHNVYARLTGTGSEILVAALRARYPAALIDEFQDTDPLQFAIFRAIYHDSGAPVFFVGDPKQAIYSFRNADLHTYLDARKEAGAEYSLAANQRSTPQLIAALNAVFAANPRAFVLDGLDYQPVHAGEKPRAQFADDGPPRAPLQVWLLPADDQGAPVIRRVAQDRVARACAAEIGRLLDAGQRGEVRIDDRPLAPADIAILVRTRRQGSMIRAALADIGIRSVELASHSIFESPDALEFERLLGAIMEPARERRLRSALATVLIGHDAAAIDALGDDEAALAELIDRFAGYRDVWQRRGVGVMLRELFVREDLAGRLLARPDGERRMTNALHLAECLHAAEQTHPSPDALLRWLKQQCSEPGEGDHLQLRLESDANLVTIATIHSAKGLEYNIVFCPYLWEQVGGGRKDDIGALTYHDDEGRPVLDFTPLDKGAAEATDGRARQKLEKFAEDVRLVYVALTRAVHRCYVVAGEHLSGSNSTKTDASRRTPLNWLAAGADGEAGGWLADKHPPSAIDAWRSLAAAERGIAVDPLPAPDAVAPSAAPAVAPIFTALPVPEVPPAWWFGSYTALTEGARHEAAAADRDIRLLPVQQVDAAPLPDDAGDILRFPRGRAAGSCVHAVFERIDFTDPASWDTVISGALRAAAFAEPHAADATAHPRQLRRMLDDVLHTEIGDGIVLGGVAADRRLVELEFTLPSRRVAAKALAAALREHDYPVPPLLFSQLDGYLRGFIDLVFEHAGRFYIADWKSNHLGNRRENYAAAAVEQAMEQHGYHLQYLLYAVALHRYLRHRRGDYRFDDHFGGVYYLFVRGVRPNWQDGGGNPCGVYRHRPQRALIERLDALFAADAEAA